MIYDQLSEKDPIRQGDIFRSVPRVEFSLSRMSVVGEEQLEFTNWRNIVSTSSEKPITAIVAIEPVAAIVITQNCDTARAKYLSLCQIVPFLTSVGREDTAPKKPKKWQSLLTTHSRNNLRLFYLPVSSDFGWEDRMAADFVDVIRISRLDLENMRDYRVGRLNGVATEHFRESLGQFFRRYPYNEWYPLTAEEFASYATEKSPERVEPYDWQK